MNLLAILAFVLLTAVLFALLDRLPVRLTLAFAFLCFLIAGYSALHGGWPYGLILGLIALVRWRARRPMHRPGG